MAKRLFIQGMRRSGTTILFDALYEDRDLELFYEPLSAAHRGLGGGSGARNVDYYENVRGCRRAFQERYPELTDTALLNYGAPRDAALELETELPEYCREYLRFLMSRAERTAFKFTRMYCKVPVLAELDPDAVFVHLVRDPRSVAASYVFGRDRRWQASVPEPDAFFTRRDAGERFNPWSSFRFSELLMERPQYAHLRGCEDFVRTLLVWKLTFEQTRADGRRCYGRRYHLMRHEDLCVNPAETLGVLYDLLGRPLPQRVADWLTFHVVPARPIFEPDDPRWDAAFDRLDLWSAADVAGYGLAPARPQTRQLNQPIPSARVEA